MNDVANIRYHRAAYIYGLLNIVILFTTFFYLHHANLPRNFSAIIPRLVLIIGLSFLVYKQYRLAVKILMVLSGIRFLVFLASFFYPYPLFISFASKRFVLTSGLQSPLFSLLGVLEAIILFTLIKTLFLSKPLKD